MAVAVIKTCHHCDGPVIAKGYCWLHYQRSRKGLPMDAPKRGYRVLAERDAHGRKQCGRCEGWKPVDEFYSAAHTTDNLMRECKQCGSLRKRMALYRITEDGLNALYEQQQACCPICHNDLSDRYVVDHDHATGRVRGLLCAHCNVLLGYAREDVEILKGAIEYIINNGGGSY